MSLDHFCAVTCLFNPDGYRSKADNFARFRAGLAGHGVPLLVVECAFDQAPFELPAGDGTMQIRAADVMWQKERLLNLAIRSLPSCVTMVAWLDGDKKWKVTTPGRAATRFLLIQFKNSPAQ